MRGNYGYDQGPRTPQKTPPVSSMLGGAVNYGGYDQGPRTPQKPAPVFMDVYLTQGQGMWHCTLCEFEHFCLRDIRPPLCRQSSLL